jgi:hypothetical protein
MNTKCAVVTTTYHLYGLPMPAVSPGRKIQSPNLKEQHHAGEVRWAIFAAQARNLK